MKQKSKLRPLILALLLHIAVCVPACAQQVGIKTNLLYDLTSTPNLAVEVGLARRVSAQLLFAINPWEFSQERMLRHWQLMPEVRFWTCQKFNGHFLGLHAMGGEFKFVDAPVLGSMFGKLKDRKVAGWNAGVGLTYGYQWILSKHWNLEAAIGVGYNYIDYERYNCGRCGRLTKRGTMNYFGPTKLALSLEYLF